MRKISLYDMDRTITVKATYTWFLLHMVLARAPWRLLLLPVLPLGLAAYACKLFDRGQLKTFNQRLLLGNNPKIADLAPHIESFADRTLDNNTHAKAREQIAADRREGRTLVLVTASYELYAEAIARRLGFDHVIATRLETDPAGAVRPRIIGENCYDREKIDRITALFDEQGWQREQCHVRAYSDHVSDRSMLEYADEAVATTPSAALRRLAQDRGWEIVDWR